ncbi:MAG: TRAP transporter small permease [Rhizobiales bacterium]|nr:TRAP transporter small permease [Hyphomicrobiales bacterium]
MASTILSSGLRRLDRLVSLLEVVLNTIGGAVLVVFAFLVLFDVIARYLFNYSIPGIYELMQLGLVVIVYFGIAYAQQKGDHVRIDLFSNDNFPRMQRVIRVAGDLAGIVICTIIAWRTGQNAYVAWLTDDSMSGLIAWRTWPAMAAVPLGFGLLAFRLAIDLVEWSTERVR